MRIGSEQWLKLVAAGAEKMGIHLTRQQAQLFAIHGQGLEQWNKKINLTAITDPVQVAVKHFLDAIAPIPFLSSRGHLLDIGTGGGFPGLPLKIMAPGLSVTLIDGVRKKINFVRHVIRQLGLQNIEALHVRAEELGCQTSYQNRFQFIIGRAVTDPAAFINLAIPLLHAEGCLIIYQGPQQVIKARNIGDADLVEIKNKSFQVSDYNYKLPFSGDGRVLTLLRCQTFQSAKVP